MILQLSGLAKSFESLEVLRNVTFHLEAHEKAALVGANGAGKTTLFHLILGEMTPDAGSIYIQRGLQIGYLPQQVEFSSDDRVEDELLKVFLPLQRMEDKMRALEQEMQQDPSPALMEQYARLQENFERSDGYAYHSRVRGVLAGLGFVESEYSLPITNLSGGQKARVALSKLLLQSPDLILMDEPTNHLDIDSITWLENYLQNYPGAVLIISHDRYFLDKICSRTIEIERGTAEEYNGNFTWYAAEKERRTELRMREYEAQQTEIRRQEEIIARLRSYGMEKFIKRAQSREKILQKMELIEKPLTYEETMHLTFTPHLLSGNDVLQAHEVAKSFDGKDLFRHVNFLIRRGEKVALLGANGTGKTTLFRMIMKEEGDYSGHLIPGVKVFPGYYDQEQENLSPEKTVLDEIYDAFPQMNLGQIRNILAAFLFRGEDVWKPIAALSGGEKARVSLCKIMLSDCNFLLLDEPTNHLDIQSRQILEQNLIGYEGTLFFISHDRYFINRVATRILVLTPEGVVSYTGNYDDYLMQLEHQRQNSGYDPISGAFADPEKKGSRNSFPSASAAREEPAEKPAENKEAYIKRKQGFAELRKKRARLRNLESEIEAQELRIGAIDSAMLEEVNYSNAQAYQALLDEKTALENALAENYSLWEELSEELE